MKRIATAIAVAALAITLIVASVLPAQGTHTLGHLRRQIARLENQVSTLQQQVRNLNHEVFICEFLDTTTPKTFADGSTGFPIYEDSICAA